MELETEVKVKEAALVVGQVVLLGMCAVLAVPAAIVAVVAHSFGEGSEWCYRHRKQKEEDSRMGQAKCHLSTLLSVVDIVKGSVLGLFKKTGEDTPSQVEEPVDVPETDPPTPATIGDLIKAQMDSK